jgi:hypothetical protein
MNDFKLAITVPTRNRPHNLKRLAKAAKETCELDYTIFARIDDDDRSNYPPNLPNVVYVRGPRIKFAKSVNELAELSADQGFTHMAILGDDVLPETKGWDKFMVEHLPEIGVGYGSDGLEHLHAPDLPTHVVIPVEMYRRLGWICLPEITHLFCDNVWRELGLITSFIYFPDVKLSHLHRWNKKAPDDKTYQEANDKTNWDADKNAFENWRDNGGLELAKRSLGV